MQENQNEKSRRIKPTKCLLSNLNAKSVLVCITVPLDSCITEHADVDADWTYLKAVYIWIIYK